MVKFQNDYTTLITTFEDFVLPVYTVINDLYKPFVPSSVTRRRDRLSDPEIITLSVCSELLGIDSENAWQCNSTTS